MFDVLVVGGGHAGVEAAVAAARAGATRVALVTTSADTIGQMSCNPAIGGIAKGTVVREVDALGGVMARATDLAAIQFRMLNRGKGPAVWAPRSQCDRRRYRLAVQQVMRGHDAVTVVTATVDAMWFDRAGAIAGVVTSAGTRLPARAVVIATGTFLRGRICIGTDVQAPGGRAGEPPTTALAEQLAAHGLATDRFKTGTPPRIDGRTVDYTALQRQDSERDQHAFRWSLHGAADPLPELPCWLTWTTAETHDVVHAHSAESAMYGGVIASRGPRYCPSIEDKVVRFPNADRHQVFLEPEGLDTPELYVNGLSTSLPVRAQLAMLHSVPGLGAVEMTKPGYAIEYDYYDPTQLFPWLESRAVPGLFFAGQVNGTTGYEEAAGQGIVAGVNAGRRAAGLEPVVFPRTDSYIGVLADDLVTRGVDEPYRLFTSRSEFRLTVRQDNAVGRLYPFASSLGLLTDTERRAFDARVHDEAVLHRLERDTSVTPSAIAPVLAAAGYGPLPHPVRAGELVKRNGVHLRDVLRAAGADFPDHGDALITVELEIKYAGYFARERENASRLEALAAFRLPDGAPYERMRTLSIEARSKLARRRPVTLAQAASIPGVSPADLQNLVLEVARLRVPESAADE